MRRATPSLMLKPWGRADGDDSAPSSWTRTADWYAALCAESKAMRCSQVEPRRDVSCRTRYTGRGRIQARALRGSRSSHVRGSSRARRSGLVSSGSSRRRARRLDAVVVIGIVRVVITSGRETQRWVTRPRRRRLGRRGRRPRRRGHPAWSADRACSPTTRVSLRRTVGCRWSVLAAAPCPPQASFMTNSGVMGPSPRARARRR